MSISGCRLGTPVYYVSLGFIYVIIISAYSHNSQSSSDLLRSRHHTQQRPKMRLFIGGILLLQALASETKAWADKKSSWDVDWDDVWDDIANIDDEDSPTKLLTPGETARAKSLLRGSTNDRTAYSSTLAKFVQKYHAKSDTGQNSDDIMATTGEQTTLRDGLSSKKATIEKFVQQVHKNSAQAKRLLAGVSQRRKKSATFSEQSTTAP
jgi:hypothetical protein